MLDVSEALRLILQNTHPVEAEVTPLMYARGQYLSASVTAPRNAPDKNESAMDGYAVRSMEAVAGATLPVHGESRAGGEKPAPLPEGVAMRIFTGAELPKGADAIVIQEDATRQGDSIQINESPTAWRFVRKVGSDFAAGAQLGGQGDLFDAGKIGLFASQGIREVPVHRNARVSLILTGDELLDLDEAFVPGRRYDASGPMLRTLLEELPVELARVERAPDTEPALRAMLTQAAQDSDLVITTGGVSVGEYDHVGDAISAAGFEQVFWKVRVKPGKPLLFGKHPETGALFLGLPGNPVSTFCSFHAFVNPLVLRLVGSNAPYPEIRTLTLGKDFRRRAGRVEWIRMRLEGSIAYPHTRQDSAALSGIGEADALGLIPAEVEELKEGSAIRGIILRSRNTSSPWSDALLAWDKE